MKIDRLKLRGFIGIQKGLGVDEISVDVGDLTGLIGLEGPNGLGKTTVLENLQPFRVLPSRTASLHHHVYLRDSYKDLSFWYGGDHYRTLVKIDAQSQNSEGFIWKNDKPEIDGKVTNYDTYLTELLGSTSLFFNSIFCAQNSKRISDLTTGKLKELFSEFLRLHELVAHENTCKQCIVVLGSLQGSVDRDIEVLKKRMEGAAETEQELIQAEEAERVAGEERAALITALVAKEEDYDQVRDAVAENLVKENRLSDFDKRIATLIADQEAKQKEPTARLEQLRTDLGRVNDELRKYKDLLAEEDKIIEACLRSAQIIKELVDLEGQRENITIALKEKQDSCNVKEREIDDQGRLLHAGEDPEVTRLRAEIRSKQEKTTDLQKRDPECQSQTCAFIQGAIQAEKELPDLKRKLSESLEHARREEERVVAQIKRLEEQLGGLEEALIAVKRQAEENGDRIKRLKREQENLKPLAEKKSDLQVALSRRADLEIRKQEITAEGIRIKETVEAAAEKIKTELEGLYAERVTLEKSIEKGLDGKRAAVEQQITTLKTDLELVDKKIELTKEKVVRLKQIQAEIGVAKNELAIKTERQKGLTQEISEWVYLRNACSKEGLQALEIDAVAPTITSYGNELLNMSFGPNYSVKFRTQDEEGREVLDILTLGEHGGEILLSNLSGGERVWILKALRLAMTLVSKEKSGREYKTIFADEEDGALSVENAKSFVQLYRSLMKIGGMDTCLFVSHKPEAVALADHRMIFGNGAIAIN